MGLFKKQPGKERKPAAAPAKLTAKPRPEDKPLSPETAEKMAAALRVYLKGNGK